MGILQMLMSGGAAGAPSEGGDDVIETATHWIHVFTTPGDFINSSTIVADYLMVGGGGWGTGFLGGGGGGGAFVYKTSVTLPVSTRAVVIGQGGNVGTGWPSYTKPSPGTSTTFNSLTASGGGGGSGAYPGPAAWQSGSPGASGGGGGGEHTPHPAGSATSNSYPGSFGVSPDIGWGHPGGNGFAPWNFCGGGGGGASAAGTAGSAPTGGPGGDGLPVSWIPSSYGTPGPQPGRYFAGGGAGKAYGGGYGVPGTPGAGAPNPPAYTSAATGGGGGPASGSDSGIVAIRYPK